MPGRNEQQAVKSFLEPLRLAASTLAGHCQIVAVRTGGAYRQGVIYQWHINGGAGVRWPGVGLFAASMNFEIVEADPQKHDLSDGPLRVTTRGYWYSLKGPDDVALWRMHWHPGDKSNFDDPHIHRQPNTKLHWPMPRMSFETAVRWCFVEGAPPSCTPEEAENRLTQAETGFRLFGSWQDPTDPGYPVQPSAQT